MRLQKTQAGRENIYCQRGAVSLENRATAPKVRGQTGFACMLNA